MDLSPDQFEKMAKATCAAYSARLGPSLKLTMDVGQNPDRVLFLLCRQTTPSAESFGGAGLVSRNAVADSGVEPFQKVLDTLLDLNERDRLPQVSADEPLPVLCKYTSQDGFEII